MRIKSSKEEEEWASAQCKGDRQAAEDVDGKCGFQTATECKGSPVIEMKHFSTLFLLLFKF